MEPTDATTASLEELRAFARRSDTTLAETRRFVAAARARCLETRAAIRARKTSPSDEENLEFICEELEIALKTMRAHEEELEKARVAMARAAGWWKELVDGAPEPYVVTDGAGLILEANRVVAVVLQFRGDLSRKPLVNFVHRADTRLVLDAITCLTHGERVDGLEVRLRPRGGAPVFTALATATWHPAFDGAASGQIRWILQRTKVVLRRANNGRAARPPQTDGAGTGDDV